jgi:hypothetical protein
MGLRERKLLAAAIAPRPVIRIGARASVIAALRAATMPCGAWWKPRMRGSAAAKEASMAAEPSSTMRNSKAAKSCARMLATDSASHAAPLRTGMIMETAGVMIGTRGRRPRRS